MARRPKSSIWQQLAAAQTAINNTLSDAEIQGMVAQYGYPAEKLSEGKRLYDSAFTAVNAQVAVAGGQYQATADLKAREAAARSAYQELAQVARAAFLREPDRLAALGLRGTAPKATAHFIAQAGGAFQNAMSLPDVKAVLAAYGLNDGKLQDGKAKIDAYARANEAQEAAKGSAQQATQNQDAALAAMNQWTAHYIKIARVALRDKPQLLEKIGVSARTGKTAAQRQAPKKAAETRANNKTDLIGRIAKD